MTDDVLELDDRPSSPTQPPGWSKRRTVAVAASLIVAMVVGLTVILWPEPPPEPQVLGLSEGPVEAWHVDHTWMDAVAVEGDRLLTATTPGKDSDQIEVSLRDLATGDAAWTREVPHNTYAVSPTKLTDLVGTPWVSVTAPGAAILLDRETGEERHRIPLKDFPPMRLSNGDGSEYAIESGSSWVSSTTAGTVLVASSHLGFVELHPSNGDAAVVGTGGPTELSAYSPDDLATPLWTVESSQEQFHALQAAGPAVEESGYAFFPATKWRTPSGQAHPPRRFSGVITMADGSTPAWFDEFSSVSIVDGTAVVNDTTKVRSFALDSGDLLWESGNGAWTELADGEAYYLLPRAPGEVQRIDVRTGKVQWARESAAFNTSDGLESSAGCFWGPDPVLKSGYQGSTTIVRHDALSGREKMRLELDVPVFDVDVYVGDDQLLVTTADTGRLEDNQLSVPNTIMGVDPDSGKIRWRRTFEGEVAFLGRHLVVIDGERATIYR